MTMSAVEANSPTAPEVRSARKMDRKALVVVLPTRRVHRRRLPLRRMGRIAFAYSCSTGSPTSARICGRGEATEGRLDPARGGPANVHARGAKHEPPRHLQAHGVKRKQTQRQAGEERGEADEG